MPPLLLPSSPSSSLPNSEPNSKEQDTDLSLLYTLSYKNPLLTISTTLILYLGSKKIWINYGKRIKNDDYLIGNSWLGKDGRRKLKGVCTSVGDGDNFRLFHIPLFRKFMKVPKTRAELKNQTLHIRLAGIDAPECAHFGNPAQPYSKEALEWLTEKVLHKNIQVELYSKDRYGRVVGMAYTRPFPYIRKHNISEEMLKVGLATVYTLGGAQYGGLKERFDYLEARAKSQKKGMWSLKGKNYESPGDYKKRTGGGGAGMGK